MERLTKRRKSQRKSKALKDLNKDLTFTPKINKKSSQLDRKRGQGDQRFVQLHNLVSNPFPKTEKGRELHKKERTKTKGKGNEDFS